MGLNHLRRCTDLRAAGSIPAAFIDADPYEEDNASEHEPTPFSNLRARSLARGEELSS